MSRVGLKQVLGRSAEARAIVDAWSAAAGGGAVEDADGRVVHGATPGADAQRFPVTHEGAVLGWVAGPPAAEAVATLLGHLAGKDAER